MVLFSNQQFHLLHILSNILCMKSFLFEAFQWVYIFVLILISILVQLVLRTFKMYLLVICVLSGDVSIQTFSTLYEKLGLYILYFLHSICILYDRCIMNAPCL
jgi:hypothetical protein